ncbi:aldehyde dehydrogenase family protein [Halorientalis pallida]|uniref:Aldehyde dehydrogenase n=1 Tax=Halorientalis pallida TaxID=2479928 RepID=A0A498L0S8_9EURY|nr:aldehyde dehydrogenase family protein [Halorientalis pallida]RXK51929.1 aldehyde dehydrogenase [Halorientalis pallida]
MATSRYAPTEHVIRGDDPEGETLAVTDLADGGTFARVHAAGPADARTAVGAAESAERAMRETTLVQRADWLDRIADELEARREELAEAIVREAGKPITSARSEVTAAVERFRRAVEEVRDLQGEYLEGTTAAHEGWRAIVEPQPVGTVLCLTPYNYPLATTALQVAPALAAGNAVIVKPATQTPVSAAILANAVDAVDLPRGAFNYVPGRASEIGDTLAGDNRIDAIAMTGSSAAGNHVAHESGMVTLHMELGGNAPALVFPDADLDETVGQCASGAFKYAGQRCSAVSRVLAHESVHDELVARLDTEMDAWTAGDLFDEDTTFGPLISEEQADHVEELVADAVERGAELVRGGERDGQFFEPTLLADVPHDARLIAEEQFGPVAVVTRFADEAEALDLANAGDLGLDAAVFTADHDRAMRLAERIEAGAVRINGTPSHGLGDIPFGGVKNSGIGREGIGYTIEAFTTTKTIVL